MFLLFIIGDWRFRLYCRLLLSPFLCHNVSTVHCAIPFLKFAPCTLLKTHNVLFPPTGPASSPDSVGLGWASTYH